MSAADISTAVADAQAVLTRVRGQLRTGVDIPAERVFIRQTEIPPDTAPYGPPLSAVG